MATQKQIDANRRNAEKSTGPKTEAGKQRSRANALKHGLAALHCPLPHEDTSEYHEMRAGLVETYEPANTQEFMLVDNIATAWVRMQRAGRWEAGLIEAEIQARKKRHKKSLKPSSFDDMGVGVVMSDEKTANGWATLARYETRAQSAWFRAIEALRKVQGERRRKRADELREHKEEQTYRQQTVADPNWQPPLPVNSTESAKMASFSDPGSVEHDSSCRGDLQPAGPSAPEHLAQSIKGERSGKQPEPKRSELSHTTGRDALSSDTCVDRNRRL